MRRTRLVAAAFAGSACLATLAPVAVAAEPVAEVSPHRVRPGGTVTVTVTCGKHSEEVGYIVAYSQAFEKGEVKLKLLPRGGYGEATYSGEARIASAHHFTGSWSSDSYGSSSESYLAEESESSSERSYGSDEDFGSGGSYGSDEDFASEDAYGSDDTYGSEESSSTEESYSSEDSGGSEDSYSWEESYSSDGSYGSGDSYGRSSSHHEKRYGVNGSCPDGRDFTASVIVERKPRGGAHAGQGGSQGAVNTTAVAAGGALVSATVGFGVYVLRRRRSEI